MRSVMTVLSLLLFGTWPAAAQQVPEVPEVPSLPREPEVANYRLSMEKLRHLVKLQRDLNALATSDPKLVQQVNRENDAVEAPLKVADGAAIMDRGYAMMAFEIKAGRLNPAAAPAPETAAERANLALLENNQAEWGKLQQELMQLWENSPWANE